MTDPMTMPASLAADFPPPTEAEWRALVEKVLKGADFRRRLVSRTADGIEIEPLYTRVSASRENVVHHAPSGSWRIAQVLTETSPQAVAAAIAEEIDGGSEAVTIRLAAPGQSGLEADFRAIDAALSGIGADRLCISLQPGSHAVQAALALATIAKRRSVRVGTLGIDPLGTLARTGELALLRADGKAFAAGVPWLAGEGSSLLADVRPYHEAGASEAQEIAALAATLVCYLRCCEGEVLSPSQALPRIGLAMAADADLFLTIAKLRAARRVVERVTEACGAPEVGGRMTMTVTTSERMMARPDPWVNLLRVTAACTAAAMGGAREIAVLPHTWALGEPDSFARRIARNVGLVLREEAGLGRISDPAGGAWYVEQLTAQMTQKAWGFFQEWEGEGGMLAALKSGLVQDQIAAVAEARVKEVATRRLELTGVSAFPQLGNDGVSAAPWPAVQVPTGALVARPLPMRRLAEPFERLRDAADAMAVPPKVFLASLGTQSDHGARTMWITNLLAAGGIGAISSDGFTNSADVGRAYAQSGAAIACLCSSDEVYAELGEAAAMALKGAGARRVYLAGRPGAGEAALEAAGVDGFLHAGIDVVMALMRIQQEMAE